jgi:hypothetical protein
MDHTRRSGDIGGDGDEIGDLGRGEADVTELGDAGVRVLSTLQQRSRGSWAISAVRSALDTPIPARKARTASGFAGDLRWDKSLEALRTFAGIWPQLVVR